jgi:hypothetical protein
MILYGFLAFRPYVGLGFVKTLSSPTTLLQRHFTQINRHFAQRAKTVNYQTGANGSFAGKASV